MATRNELVSPLTSANCQPTERKKRVAVAVGMVRASHTGINPIIVEALLPGSIFGAGPRERNDINLIQWSLDKQNGLEGYKKGRVIRTSNKIYKPIF